MVEITAQPLTTQWKNSPEQNFESTAYTTYTK